MNEEKSTRVFTLLHALRRPSVLGAAIQAHMREMDPPFPQHALADYLIEKGLMKDKGDAANRRYVHDLLYGVNARSAEDALRAVCELFGFAYTGGTGLLRGSASALKRQIRTRLADDPPRAEK